MAFYHQRKLLSDCEPFCDEAKGICPVACMALCPDSCKAAVLLQIPPPPPPPPIAAAILPRPKSNGIPLVLTIGLAVLAVAFFFFTCYTIYKFYVSCYGGSRRLLSSRRDGTVSDGGDEFVDGNQGPVVDHPIWYIRTVGLQPSVISAITVIKYKKGDGVIDGTDCAVCLSEFGEDETLRLLPKCNHAFHIPCIDTWLRSHTNCPMCRAGIVNNANPVLPIQEEVIGRDDSGREDEARVGEVGSEGGNGTNEVRIRVEEDDEVGLKIDGSGEGGLLDGVQPVRRSVSVNSFAGSMISGSRIGSGFGGKSCDDGFVEGKESINGVDADKAAISENCPANETGPSCSTSSSMKRSHSCSAKVLLTRHSSRNRN